MPTIGDVARAAGVGIGTVSRVLNGSRLVSAVTRQRVLEAIERLGYQPSPIARAFGRRRTGILELLVPRFAQAFLLEIMRGIEEALVDTDFTLMMRIIENGADRDRVLEECCLPNRADGALLVWVPPTDVFVERLLAQQFPAVLLNAVHPRLSSVVVDHDAAAERAVAYCIRLGHRRIALIDRPQDPLEQLPPGLCQRGYRRALADAGIGLRDGYEHLAGVGALAGASAVDALLVLPDPPTAILAASESQAIGALEAARGRGWRVPQDLSVVGYNDNEFAAFLGLTTISVPLREIGRQATEQLLAAVAEPSTTPEVRYLPTNLLVRQTCGPPAPREHILR